MDMHPWEKVYRESVAREKQLRDEKHQLHMQLIRCESQRLSMMFTLQLAAEYLARTQPEFATHVISSIQQLRKAYEGEQPAKTLGKTAAVDESVSGHSGPTRCAPVHTETGTTQQAPF